MKKMSIYGALGGAILGGMLILNSGVARAQESPHGKLAFACEDCHTALTFKFKKSATRCADCHQTPTNYTTTCCTNSGCHSKCTGDS